MNKSENEKNIFDNIAQFAQYENPNNFDEYFSKLLPKLSKKKFIYNIF